VARHDQADQRREELQFHFDAAVEAALAQRLSPDAARREARRRVGSVPAAEVSAHEGVGLPWLDAAARDIRQATRSLRRHVAFTTVAALVLCLSVGVATLLFALFDGVLLRPLPYRAPDRLIRVFDSTPTTPRFPMAIARYVEFRDSARTLAGLALYTGRDMELAGDGQRSMPLTGVAVTTDFFSLLGWAPASGRTFTDGDLRQSARAVILSDVADAVCRRPRHCRAGDPAQARAVDRGRRDAGRFQHVGGDYRSPPQGDTVDIWLPLSIEGDDGNLRASHFCNAIARIRDGRSLGDHCPHREPRTGADGGPPGRRGSAARGLTSRPQPRWPGRVIQPGPVQTCYTVGDVSGSPQDFPGTGGDIRLRKDQE
jgi:hypothetical protein